MRINRFVAVIMLLACATVRAQTLADRVPANTIAYVGWKGADSPDNGYAGSHLQAIIDASGFAQLRDQLIPQLMQKIKEQGGDKGANAIAAQKTLQILWKHPTAAFFAGMGKDANGGPVPHLGMICQAGDDSNALMAILTAAAHQASAPPMSRAFTIGDCTVFLIGYENDAAIPAAGDSAKSLKADPNFVRMTTETGNDPLICGYLDVAAAFAQIDEAVATNADDHAKTVWPKARDASGLNGIKHVSFGCGFDGRDWQSNCFVEAPAPRDGLLTLIEPTSMDAALLSRIPATAKQAALGQFNLGLLLTQARAIAVAVDPAAGDAFDKGMGLVQMMVGRNLQTDILNPLGAQWVLYSDDSIPAATVTATQPVIQSTNLVAVNKLADPAKALQGWTALSYAISNASAGYIQSQNLPISTVMTKNGDQSVFTIVTPYAQPSWTIKDGFIYFGFSPEGVVAAANRTAGAVITQQPGFVDIAKKVGAAADFSGFQYADLPVSIAKEYVGYETQIQTVRALLEQQSIKLPEHILPPLDKWLAELTPSLSLSWADANGWHSRTHAPYPAASPQSGEITVGVTALGASILLPSLNRARETANRVKCASNERQIGMACLLFANDHKGKYPTNFADMLTEDVGPDIFLCPSTSSALPKDYRTMAPADMATWLTDHSDYVYVGAGMTSATEGATDIVVYEKPEDHQKSGINILFGDGHVEFVLMADAVKMIQDQHKTVPTVKLPDAPP